MTAASATRQARVGRVTQETRIEVALDLDAVSYTHLTLPTIYSV